MLPVVDSDGDLSLEALETAHGVTAVEDVDDDTVDEVQSRIEDLAESEFDHQIESPRREGFRRVGR